MHFIVRMLVFFSTAWHCSVSSRPRQCDQNVSTDARRRRQTTAEYCVGANVKVNCCNCKKGVGGPVAMNRTGLLHFSAVPVDARHRHTPQGDKRQFWYSQTDHQSVNIGGVFGGVLAMGRARAIRNRVKLGPHNADQFLLASAPPAGSGRIYRFLQRSEFKSAVRVGFVPPECQACSPSPTCFRHFA